MRNQPPDIIPEVIDRRLKDVGATPKVTLHRAHGRLNSKYV